MSETQTDYDTDARPPPQRTATMDRHWTRDGKRYRLQTDGDRITLRGLRSAVTTWRWPWHTIDETLEQIGFEPDERPSE